HRSPQGASSFPAWAGSLRRGRAREFGHVLVVGENFGRVPHGLDPRESRGVFRRPPPFAEGLHVLALDPPLLQAGEPGRSLAPADVGIRIDRHCSAYLSSCRAQWSRALDMRHSTVLTLTPCRVAISS